MADPAPQPKAREAETLIDVRALRKTFSLGLFRRRTVEAVREVSFTVHRGEIVGFLGPNGSGKTTTIKILTGHIRATAGQAYLFGQRVPSLAARRRIGFLPENPYIYPYLTPREFVHMCGRLSGMRGRALRSRAERVLDEVGVLYAADRQVRRLSKGMLQRAALAAALVADPEMLVLDEPMSGLDPVGRKEVRDILFSERDLGRTIFFSTHILSDVEAMCDHVIILRAGRVVESGPIRSLLRSEVRHTEITIAEASPELRGRLARAGHTVLDRGDVVLVEVLGSEQVQDVLAQLLDSGAVVVAVTPRRDTLEDLFLKRAL